MKQKKLTITTIGLCILLSCLCVAQAGLDPNTFGARPGVWNMNSTTPSTSYYSESRQIMTNNHASDWRPIVIMGRTGTGGGGQYEPTLTAYGEGDTGGPTDAALSFDGVNDVAHTLSDHQAWNSEWKNWQVEFYFKPNRITGDAQELLGAAGGSWAIQIVEMNDGEYSELRFTANAGTINARVKPLDSSIIGQWNHVAATAIDGVMKIYLNGELGIETAEYESINEGSEQVFLGGTNWGARPYSGLLDDLTISDYIKPIYADPGTFGTPTIWKMNSSIETDTYYNENRTIILNEETEFAPILVLGRASEGGGGEYEPTITEPGEGRTGTPDDSALSFDGVNDVAHSLAGHKAWDTDWENWQVEFYFKPDRVRGTAQDIIAQQGTWAIQIVEIAGGLAEIRFSVNAGSIIARSEPFGEDVIGKWNHLYATAIDGELKVALNSVVGSQPNTYQTLNEPSGGIFMGSTSWGGRPYGGLIDDVIISDYIIPLIADINSDGVVDYEDFAIMASQWLAEGEDLSADLNESGNVSEDDLMILINQWLKTAE